MSNEGVLIKLTQEHNDEARTRGSAVSHGGWFTNCLIAVAVEKVFPGRKIKVIHAGVYIDDNFFKLPPIAMQALTRFDGNQPFNPCEFYLDVPAGMATVETVPQTQES